MRKTEKRQPIANGNHMNIAFFLWFFVWIFALATISCDGPSEQKENTGQSRNLRAGTKRAETQRGKKRRLLGQLLFELDSSWN